MPSADEVALEAAVEFLLVIFLLARSDRSFKNDAKPGGVIYKRS